MDIDKTRKPKKEKPYVLIFVVLAVLYLAYAIIWELLPVNASSPSTLGSSYVICMPSDGRDARPAGAGDFFRFYSDGTDPLGLHDVIKIDDITMSLGNWSNGRSVSSWLQNTAYVLTMDSPIIAGYLQFKQGWYGRTLIYGSIDMPQYVTGTGIDTMPFDRVTAWPAYVNGVYYVDTNGLYCLSRSSHLLYTHFSPSLAEYASERLYFSDNSEEPNPVLVYRDGVWTEELFENTVHTSETPHAVQKILNAGQGFVFFEIYDPDGYYVTKDYIPDDIGCWIEYTAFESDNTATPTPTEGPTPTPELSNNPYVIFRSQGWWPNTNYASYGYYCFEFEGDNLGFLSPEQPFNFTVQGTNYPNNALTYVMSEYGVGTTWQRSVALLPSVIQKDDSYTYSETFLLYFSGQLTGVKAYSLGTYLISTDLSVLKEHYNPVYESSSSSVDNNSTTWCCGNLYGIRPNTSNTGPMYRGYLNDLNVFGFCCASNFTEHTVPFELVTISGLGKVDVVTGTEHGGSYSIYNNCKVMETLQIDTSPIVLAYRYGLSQQSVLPTLTPTPEPTPDPNATPTPEPTPTPQTVIINWPTGTPTPTPMGVLNVTMPPYGNDLNVLTSRNVLGSGLNLLRSRAQTGLLAKAFSFVPTELQTLIWFLVFVLIILAVIRLIIHFGG